MSPTLTVGQRRSLIAAAYLAGALPLITGSAFDSLLVPIDLELELSIDDTVRLSLLPGVFGLIMVFVAGTLALRFGRRPVLLISSAVVGVGALLVGIAGASEFTMVGFALCGLGGIPLAVVGLSLINVTFTTRRQRGRAFGVFGAITPAVFLTIPGFAAMIADFYNWRLVPILPICGAAAVFALTLFALPRLETKPTRVELGTPILAGVALTAMGVAAVTLVSPGPYTVGALLVALASVVAVVILKRRPGDNGLDFSVLQSPGGALTGVALLLIYFVKLNFYVDLFMSFRYDLPWFTGVFLIALCEAAGLVGSLAFGSLAGRMKDGIGAIVATALGAVLALTLLGVTATTPPWVLIALVMAINLPIAGAVGPVTEYLLSHKPESGSDLASSVSDALSNLGVILGAVLVGFLAFAGFERSFTDELVSHGVSVERAESIAAEIRDGVTTVSIADRESALEPGFRELLLNEGGTLHVAQVSTLHIAALVLAGAFAASSGLLVAAWRRTPDRD